ncbi:hypothetical protein HOA92_04320 [archaeon]|jgi:hypothetical protein|nr:hypothetical protein [archaeon]MBT6762240.1 hypothetical protein [archaeon]
MNIRKISRKGQSNMFWIIIGAVIALVVMIVLLLLFTSKTKILEGGVSGCEGKSGECVDPDIGCGSGTLEAPFECSNPSYTCCLGFGNDDDSLS